MTEGLPFLSVVVPTHNGSEILPRSLGALRASDLPPEHWELIVVDDASDDETAVVAAEYADMVVRLPGKPSGPAYARNRGFEACRGDVVVFIDSDVCVHPDSLRRFAELFAREPEVSAAFGSYDSNPAAAGLVSQYRNLMHAFVHRKNAGPAETFWAGCGAVRRRAFGDVGMFDEWHYYRPEIEDIELGRRLRHAGHRIVLRPEIQCTHLKRWTLWDTMKTDFRSRGVPWMWLILQEGRSAASRALNLRTTEKLCTVLAWTSLLSALSAAVWRTPWPLVLSLGALGGVLGLSFDFYRFLRRERGFGFALAVIPLHLLYHLTNAVSVFGAWFLRALFGKPQPPADVEARAEVGVKSWPPSPSRPSLGVWRESSGAE